MHCIVTMIQYALGKTKNSLLFLVSARVAADLLVGIFFSMRRCPIAATIAGLPRLVLNGFFT